MSEMERNKGRLIYQPIDTENFTEEYFETYEENGFMVIDGDIYAIEWDVKRDTDCFEFAGVEIGEDGVIHFHTMHYNGSGCLSEVIERALK